MAMWLRMLVHPLVIRRELDHALDYVQNAQQFIEQHKVGHGRPWSHSE